MNPTEPTPQQPDATSEPVPLLPVPEVQESDSEEAWNDFQDTVIEYEVTFGETQFGDSKAGELR